VSISLLFLPVKAANISQIDACNQSENNLLKMQSYKSLPLHCRSCEEWGGNRFAISFANKSCQYVRYA
jgi:hypothetical protein